MHQWNSAYTGAWDEIRGAIVKELIPDRLLWISAVSIFTSALDKITLNYNVCGAIFIILLPSALMQFRGLLHVPV